MDEAAGDLKQALPNMCDNVQIHVEVHQKSNRSLLAFGLCDVLLLICSLTNRKSICA